jgi:hypothetical protein
MRPATKARRAPRTSARVLPLSLRPPSSAPPRRRAQDSGAALNRADPRVGLGGGWKNAKAAARNVDLVAHRDRPKGFFNPASAATSRSRTPTWHSAATTSSRAATTASRCGTCRSRTTRSSARRSSARGARATYRCTATCSSCRSRTRAAAWTAAARASPTRRAPTASAACASSTSATCGAAPGGRGADLPRLAHAHPRHRPARLANVYVYVSGTSPVRPGRGARGLLGRRARRRLEHRALPDRGDPGAGRAPQDARVVSSPRLFADSATGAIAALEGRRARRGHADHRRDRPVPRTSPSTRRSGSRRAPARGTGS